MKATVIKYVMAIMCGTSYNYVMAKVSSLTLLELFFTSIPLCVVVIMITEIFIKSVKED